MRETLRIAVARDAGETTTESLVDIATRIFGPGGGATLELPSRAQDTQRPPPDFAGPEFDR